MEFRIDDLGKISGVRRTPQGGLDVPAHLTRSGVFLYHMPDGTVRRELRPAEEVFKSDSMETLAGATVTIGHPGLVRPDNWQDTAVGHVGDTVKQDHQFIDSRVRVQRGDAVKAVENKDLVELSCGYTCDVEITSGERDGEHYDAIQRNIRYNHVALLPEGGGRAGSEVKLRMDGADVIAAASYNDSMELAEALKQIEKLQGQLDGQTARADAAEARATKAEKAQKELDVEALVADRLALVQDAAKILGAEAKLDSKGGPTALMAKAVAKAYPNLKLDGKSEEYLRGLFDSAVASAEDGAEKVAHVHVKVDGKDAVKDPIAEARKRNEERARNGWKGNGK